MAEQKPESRITDVQKTPEETVVTVAGDIDLQHSVRFEQEALDLLAKTEGVLIFDLTQVGYLDSSGLASLVKVQSRSRKEGKRLRLAGLNDRVRGLFDITRLSSVFEIFDTLDDARKES
jgi:anti-sigma B factor antagonist